MLSAVHAVVVCLSVRLSVHLQIMPHDRPGTLVFKWDVLVTEFLLTSVSCGPSAIAELLVIIRRHRLHAVCRCRTKRGLCAWLTVEHTGVLCKNG